jgi:hypothetical protein
VRSRPTDDICTTRKPRLPECGAWQLLVGDEEFLPQVQGLGKFRYWEVRHGGIYFLDTGRNPLLKFFFGSGRVIVKTQALGFTGRTRGGIHQV